MWNVFADDLFVSRTRACKSTKSELPRGATALRAAPTDWDLAAERIGKAVLDVCPRCTALIFVGAGGVVVCGCAAHVRERDDAG